MRSSVASTIEVSTTGPIRASGSKGELVNRADGGRGVYFKDPDGHLLGGHHPTLREWLSSSPACRRTGRHHRHQHYRPVTPTIGVPPLHGQ